ADIIVLIIILKSCISVSRPFFNKSIHQLEAVLSENRTDPEFLKVLQDELSYRSTDRAKKLKSHVDALLMEQPEKQHFPPAVTTVNVTPQGKVSPMPASKTGAIQNFSMTEEDKNRVREKVELEKRKTLSNEAPDILRSWTALEVLTPQAYRPPEKHLIASLENATLPWEGQGERSRPNQRLYYEIVLGTIELEKAVAALLDIYVD